jgi:SAM-dependent methyltransferase
MSAAGHPEDWVVSPNISTDPATYELENQSLQRDGRLDRALHDLAPWDDRTLVDEGCGTGFWLPVYAQRASAVIGVEPDPALLELAARRTAGSTTIQVHRGSAEHLPLADCSADVVHARFAYFFGPGGEAGLAEVTRILEPGGVLLVVDNSWTGGDFAELLRSATHGNAALDPEATAEWWADQGAIRHDIDGGWMASSSEELEQILRLEFPADVVDTFMAHRDTPMLSYRFAVYELRRPVEA